MPVSQWGFVDRVLSVVVRTRGEPGGVVEAVRRAVWSVDPDQAVVRVAAMEDLVAASAEDRRFALRLFEGFALAALVLVGAGIYGTLSGRVVERTREIGVRAALGASRGALVALVLRHGLALTALGVTLGVAASAGATPSLRLAAVRSVAAGRGHLSRRGRGPRGRRPDRGGRACVARGPGRPRICRCERSSDRTAPLPSSRRRSGSAKRRPPTSRCSRATVPRCFVIWASFQRTRRRPSSGPPQTISLSPCPVVSTSGGWRRAWRSPSEPIGGAGVQLQADSPSSPATR